MTANEEKTLSNDGNYFLLKHESESDTNPPGDNPEAVGQRGVFHSTIFLVILGLVSIFFRIFPSHFITEYGLDQSIIISGLAISASVVFSLQLLHSLFAPLQFDKNNLLKISIFVAFSFVCIIFRSLLLNAYIFNFLRMGGFIFIILQQVLVLDFAHSWSSGWVRTGMSRITVDILEETDCFKLYKSTHLLLLFTVSIIYGLIFVITMSILYKNFANPGCDSTISILSITTILMGAALFIQLFLSSKGSILISGVIAVNAAVLTICSVSLHPDIKCNPTLHDSSHSHWLPMALGVLSTFLSITWNAVFSSRRILSMLTDGSSNNSNTTTSHTLLATNTKTKATNFSRNLRYSVFCANVSFLATACFIAMVLTNWGVDRSLSFSWDGQSIHSQSTHTTSNNEENGGYSSNLQAGYVSMWMQCSGAWISIGFYVIYMLIPDFRILPRSIWDIKRMFF